MGAPTTLTTLRPALANGAITIPESERPRRRHPLEAAGLVLVSCPPGLSTAGARRRRQRRAGRRQERGRSQSREARPAERSAAGCLDEVGKVLSRALVVLGSVLVEEAEEHVDGLLIGRLGLAFDLNRPAQRAWPS